MNTQAKYNIYPSLLDQYQNYLDSFDIWAEYYGNIEEPKFTEQEFEQQKYTDLLNSINRVPFSNIAADKGTVFNEIVDCLIELRKSDKMTLISDKQKGIIKATYKENIFEFPISVCQEFAKYFTGAVSQVFCEATMQTRYGLVNLYGYIDELMPYAIHDIKTTSKYKAGKYRKGWQRFVYPYCLEQQGNKIDFFEFDVLNTETFESYKEVYKCLESDKSELQNFIEQFIEFLEFEKHKGTITDKKIFNFL